MDVLPYDEAWHESWLRCRVLSFLRTDYYDDVVTTKPRYDPGVELDAVVDGQVVGLLDAVFDGRDATLECIAVHPDHQRRGIGRALLDEGRARLTALGATSLTAWTREDPSALAWYRSLGFVETFRYVHAYGDDVRVLTDVVATTAEWSTVLPRALFLHADIEDEARLRGLFARVYVCRALRVDWADPAASGSRAPGPVGVKEVLARIREERA